MKNNVKAKKGSVSVFLCIVLSAVILVESIYFYGSWMRNAEADLQRCMQLQLSYALSEYNEDLFRNYGLYAMEKEASSTDVFSDCFSFPGMARASFHLENELNGDALFTGAVAYSKMRFPAVAVSSAIDIIKKATGVLKESDFSENLDEMNLQAGSFIQGFFSGQEKIAPVLETAKGVMEFLVFDGSLRQITGFIDEWLQNTKRGASLGLQGSEEGTPFADFTNPASFSKIGGTLDQFIGAELPSFAEDLLFNEYLVGLFDSQIRNYESDKTTPFEKNYLSVPFSDIHEENRSDLEFLFSGIENEFISCYIANYTISLIRSCIRVAEILLDKEDMETAKTIGGILDVLIIAASGGTVALGAEVYQYLVVAVWGIGKGLYDTFQLVRGEVLPFFENDQLGGFSDMILLGLRDYYRFLFLFIPRDIKLERCLFILRRDCGEYLPTVAYVDVDFMSDTYSQKKGYSIYESE